MDSFYFARQERRLYAALGGALNDRRDANKIGVLHVVGCAALFVEIGIAGDAMLFGPCAAADRGIVGVGYRRKNRAHSFEKTLLRHEAKTRQWVGFHIIHAQAILHAENDPLWLAAGTELATTAVFDNSALNPNNPDPAATVNWGQQTTDEMFSVRFKFRVAKAGEGGPRSEVANKARGGASQ